jgi:HNH endonuclease
VRSAELVLVCNISAFRRGHTHPGEACHIIGAGPVPVSVAWDVADDAFIKAVLHDGVAIDTVAHYGRHINAELRTALGLGVPPAFDGAVCAEEGCDRRYHLQFDHRDPVAHLGPTSLENLQPMCRRCHGEKTERDRRAGLLTPASVDPDPDDPDEPFPP